MKIICRAISALLIGMAAFAGVAHAALDDSGTGARGVAMGQAQVAAANDASVNSSAFFSSSPSCGSSLFH